VTRGSGRDWPRGASPAEGAALRLEQLPDAAAGEFPTQLAGGCRVGCGDEQRAKFAGLRSEPAVEGRPGPKSVVVALDPNVGTLVTPNALVTIKLKVRSAGDPH